VGRVSEKISWYTQGRSFNWQLIETRKYYLDQQLRYSRFCVCAKWIPRTVNGGLVGLEVDG
jgi:hypothetical protein